MPGVGPKSAQRIAFYLLKLPKEDAQRLAHAINEVKDRISFCTRCYNIAEGELCGLCLDERRDPTLVCVVEEPRDIVAVEKTQEFRGRYHVLQGAINPIEGVGPEQLRVKKQPRAAYRLFTTSASPWPPPPQRAAAPVPPPLRFSSCRSVSARRAPDMPIGWPRAMAPPFTFTMSASMPRSSIEARPTAANAS